METELNIHTSPKKNKVIRFIKRFVLAFVISLIAIISITTVLVYVYKDDVIQLVIKELNKHLNSKVDVAPQNIDLTIIKSFPKCAIQFKNCLINESNNYKTHDTLLFAETLALEFNIKDLFNKNYTINKITLQNAKLNLKQDASGSANYIVWKDNKSTNTQTDSLKFALENISLSNVQLNYKNAKSKLKINTLLSKVTCSGKFTETNYILTTTGKMHVNLFQVQKVKYIEDKNVALDVKIDVNNNTFTILKADTKINETLLNSTGSFIINDSLTALDIFFTGKNLDIGSTLSLMPESFQNNINDYNSTGTFYAKGECHYKVNKPFVLNATFGIQNATINYKPNTTQLTNVNLEGNIVINENRSSLKLDNIKANLNNNSFAGNVELTNFNNPYLTLNVDASTNLEDFTAFYPIDTLKSLTGNVQLKATIEGFISELKSNAFNPNIKATGNANLLNIKAQFKNSEKEINIPEGQVILNNRNLEVTNLKLIKGKSDITIIGDIPNFLGYLFDTKQNLNINATVTSNFVELEDFVFATNGSNSNSTSTVSIPKNLDFNIVLNIKKLSFQKFNAELLSGKLILKNQKIAVKEVSFKTMEGNVSMNAFADASANNIKISGDCNIAKINIQQLFFQLNNFGQNTLQDKNLKGFATANVNFTANWDKTLKVDFNTVKASSDLFIERGELVDFKPLESLAKYIDINELKTIKFSSLQSTIEINNNTITLPKTSIKSSAINLDLWGTHTFDNKIDYHIQLLISELLAKKIRKNKNLDEELSLVENDPENRRSVFVLMTGTIDKPIIKYDKKGAKQKIKDDIKQEKQTLKQLLKDEFGWFKKDSTLNNNQKKSEQQFNINIGEDSNKNKPLQPKKKEDNEDF